MKYATLHFAFIYMAFINNLRWRNFGLCAKVSVYRAGTSDRVFQRGGERERGGGEGSIAPSRDDFSSGKLPRGAWNRRIYARAFRIGRRVGARTPFKGRSTNIGFPFSRESQTAWRALRFLFTNTHGAAVVDMKKREEKKRSTEERGFDRQVRGASSQR